MFVICLSDQLAKGLWISHFWVVNLTVSLAVIFKSQWERDVYGVDQTDADQVIQSNQKLRQRLEGVTPNMGWSLPNKVNHCEWNCLHERMLPHSVRDSPAIVELDNRFYGPWQDRFIVAFGYLLFTSNKGAISLGSYEIFEGLCTLSFFLIIS